MGIEDERRDTKGEDRDPEIYQVRRPQRQGDIEQRDQGPHAQVDTRSGEPREQYAEVYPRSREPTSGGNVPSTT